MLRVRDIMTREVLTLDPLVTLRGAMEMLASRHVSGAPVLEGSRVVGVISATDLLSFAADLPAVPATQQSEMDRGPDDGEAAVADEDGPASTYFIDYWGDDGSDAGEHNAFTGMQEWNMLDEHTVGEAMTRAPVHSLPSTAMVLEAAELMERESIHRLIVMDGHELTGIVTSTDVNRAAAEGKLGRRVYLFPGRK